MTAPERIWTASTNGKCHVGFDAPSLNYTNEYVRADLAAVQPDPRDEVIARLVEAVEHLLLNYLQDEFDEPDLCVDEGHWLAISDLRAILAAIPQKDAPND